MFEKFIALLHSKLLYSSSYYIAKLLYSSIIYSQNYFKTIATHEAINCTLNLLEANDELYKIFKLANLYCTAKIIVTESNLIDLVEGT